MTVSVLQEMDEPLEAYRAHLRLLLLLATEEDEYSSALRLHLHKQQAYMEYIQRVPTSAGPEDTTAQLRACFQGTNLYYHCSETTPESPHHFRVGPSL